MVDKVLKLKELRRNLKREIKHVFVILTPSCSKNCIYCYEKNLWKNVKVDVDVDRILFVIDKYKPNKVTFIGGESFESEYLFELVGLIPEDVRIDIFTDAERRKEHFEVLDRFGNVVLRLSLDTTWRTRSSSIDRWIEACDWVKFLGNNFSWKRVSIEPVLTKFGFNWNVLRKMIGESVRVYLKPVAVRDSDNLDICNDIDFDFLVKSEFERYREGKPVVAQVGKFIEQVKRVFNGGVNVRCSCFINRVTVDWEGNEAFCDAYRLSKFSDIPLEKAFDIWVDYSKKCYNCDVIEFCGGSCVLLGEPNDFYCLFRKTFIKYALLEVLNNKGG